jgi:hypothetical protein
MAGDVNRRRRSLSILLTRPAEVRRGTRRGREERSANTAPPWACRARRSQRHSVRTLTPEACAASAGAQPSFKTRCTISSRVYGVVFALG